MTKEEFKNELIRMFDSLRTENKGRNKCISVKCIECPLFDHCSNIFNSMEIIEIVEQWSKDHPIDIELKELSWLYKTGNKNVYFRNTPKQYTDTICQKIFNAENISDKVKLELMNSFVTNVNPTGWIVDKLIKGEIENENIR